MKVRFEGCDEYYCPTVIELEMLDGFRRVKRGKLHKGDMKYIPKSDRFVPVTDIDFRINVKGWMCVIRKGK